MNQVQFVHLCSLLGDIMRKLELIEMQIENCTLQFFSKRRELKLEETFESRHWVLQKTPHSAPKRHCTAWQHINQTSLDRPTQQR